MTPPEIQAVLLAGGRGSRMTQLLGNTIPKCLVPIAGNPLIYYPLKSLHNAGFTDILVIIQNRDDIRKLLEKIGEKIGLSIEIFSIEEDSDDFGTAESLRLAMSAKKIHGDVLVVSCDILTDCNLRELIDFHERKNADFSALFAQNIPLPVAKLPGPKNKVKQERDIIGVNSETDELVFMASEADFDDELSIPTAIFSKFHHIKIISWLTDAHIYLLNKSVLEFLENHKSLVSLKGEFLPLLIKNQMEGSEPKSLRFFGLRKTNCRCIRVNSVSNVSIANKSGDWVKSICNQESICTDATKIPKTAKLAGGCIVGERCDIGEKVKLTNVIIMNDVRIEDNAVLENTVVSSFAQIGSQSVLKDCLVGPKYQVNAGGHYKNEFLTVMEDGYFEAI